MQIFTWMHYKAIAEEIRELYPIELHDTFAIAERGVLTTLALNLAKRFAEDNPNFDPHRFLDACSPNTDLYPLSELWEN